MRSVWQSNGVLLGLAAVGVVGVAFIFYNQNRLNTQIVEKQRIGSALEQISNSIKVKATSYHDWERTKQWAANSSLSCLRLGSDCAGQGGEFVLMDRENREHRAFDRSGKPCANYGRGDCLIAVKLKWEPVCPPAGAGGCKNPQVRVTPTFQYAGPPVLGGIGLERYQTDFVVGGTVSAAAATTTQGLCPVGQFVSGLQNGVVQCAPPPGASGCTGVPPDCSQLNCKFGLAMLGCAGTQWLCVCAR